MKENAILFKVKDDPCEAGSDKGFVIRVPNEDENNFQKYTKNINELVMNWIYA